MKNIYIKILVSICSLLMATSCSGFLDQVPEEKLNEQILFDTREDVVKVLTHIYSYTPHLVSHDAEKKLPGNAADDMDVMWNNYDWYKKDIGLYSASSPIFNRFPEYYEAIRYCMYFNSRLDECKDPNLIDEERAWWRGEADFLQAWYYFILMTQYGPVPVMDRVYEASEIINVANNGYRRSSMAEMTHHIDSLLIEADKNLDLYYTTSGTERASRASKLSANFLRARLWLYMASPLYNGMKHPVTGKDYGHLNPKDHEGNLLLSTSYDSKLWTKALELSQKAIDLAHEANRELYKPAGSNGYTAMWKLLNPTRSGDPNIETIHYSQTDNIGGFRQASLPISWAGYSGITTFAEHIEEYFMANGLMPQDDVEYKSVNTINTFYEYTNAGQTFKVPMKLTKRDPRLYINVLFPGQYSYAVLGNEVESTTTRWAYNTTSSFTDNIYFRPWYDGQDGYTRRIGRNYSLTGFNVIKWTSKTDNSNGKGDYGYAIFRVADLYLMHAEAAIENDIAQGKNPANNPNVFKYWDMVRQRIEIPTVRDAYQKAGIPLNGNKLRELIHRERRIEFAFEGQRYYDNRRWLDAEREGGAKRGMDIFKSENGGFWNDNYIYETRIFDEKMYFMPINQTERDKNHLFTQNVGW